jgi:hypothetical protein
MSTRPDLKIVDVGAPPHELLEATGRERDEHLCSLCRIHYDVQHLRARVGQLQLDLGGAP